MLSLLFLTLRLSKQKQTATLSYGIWTMAEALKKRLHGLYANARDEADMPERLFARAAGIPKCP